MKPKRSSTSKLLERSEKQKAVLQLQKRLANSEKQAIRRSLQEKGKPWLLEQHLFLGLPVRNALRESGFQWSDVLLDGVWGELLCEAVGWKEKPQISGKKILPFKIVDPARNNRNKTCVPLFSLKAAAGKFSESQDVEPAAWVQIQTSPKLREGMFVAQVVGKSMEPLIPDGSYGLFTSPIHGSREGKILLVQHHAIHDLDTGGTYAVKKYTSEKEVWEGGWKHSSIVLRPLNPAYEPIAINAEDAKDLRVIAEWLEILRPKKG